MSIKNINLRNINLNKKIQKDEEKHTGIKNNKLKINFIIKNQKTGRNHYHELELLKPIMTNLGPPHKPS